ncbi:serine/threonine-protein kinase Vhs1p [[Candida] jaroonii]|uniref:Serine/threonine-protein kinase Vhs1p n=1 Tax=[Candida] jaroonii TaxID=467808 RepID=A0ACA9YB12_9ASCO|nr:serine/threonine-protein kinase Vhs1p [[Candida] jaroonii]
MTLHVLPIIENDFNKTPIVPNFKFNPNKTLNGLYLNENYQFVKKIGAGTYGLIYLVRDVLTDKKYAAKIILKEQVGTLHQRDIENYKKFICEKIYYEFINKRITLEELNLDLIRDNGNNISYLKELSIHLKVHQHPNVVTIHKVYNFDVGIITLMDYYEQGDLFKNIVDNQIFDDNVLMMKNCILQIINIINYMKQCNVYHCDLKPENIMVRYNLNYQRNENDDIINFKELQIGIIDFGLSIEDSLICCNSCRGSSFYMAPERIVNYTKNDYIHSIMDLNEYSKREDDLMYFPTLKGDIWSIGILIINITCARNPWPNSSIVPNNNDVFQTYIYNNKSILKKILPISMEFNSLLNKIFKLNPNERVDLKQLYNDIINVDFFHDRLLTPPESPRSI